MSFRHWKPRGMEDGHRHAIRRERLRPSHLRTTCCRQIQFRESWNRRLTRAGSPILKPPASAEITCTLGPTELRPTIDRPLDPSDTLKKAGPWPVQKPLGRRVLLVEDVLSSLRPRPPGCKRLEPGSWNRSRPWQRPWTSLWAEKIDEGLDINLCGEMAYPVADALPAGSVPFIFVTGYDCATIPMCYVRVPDCENPINLEQIARTMFG